MLAHRFAYELTVGPIPKGLTIDHVRERGCILELCCNPAHLEPVTLQENLLRGGTFQAANAAKTHCPRGHPYAGGNLYVRPDGSRRCRTCACEAAARKRGTTAYPGRGLANAAKTHCPKGHPYDKANTHVDPTGARHCRTCARNGRRRRKQAAIHASSP